MHTPPVYYQHKHQGTVIFCWLIVAILASLFIGRFIPPIQSPDENVHLLRGAMLANGQILLERAENPVRDSGLVDVNLIRFANELANMPTKTTTKDVRPPAHERVQHADSPRWAGTETVFNAAGTGYYAPVIYLPHAVGLWLSKQFNLSILQSYELARGVVVTFALGLAAYAFSLFRPNILVLMILMTPMSLFQWASPTIDGICNALTLLTIALWAKISFSDSDEHRARLEILLYICLFVLCTARTHMLPALLIPVILLVQHFSVKRLIAFAFLFGSVLGWIGFAASISGQSFLNRTHSTKEIILIYAQHPGQFLSALANTLGSPELLNFYTKSFVGILGWLNAPIRNEEVRIIYLLMLVALIWNIFRISMRDHVALRTSGITIFFGSILVAFLALAVTWNDYPVDIIAGFQGRYLTAPLVVLAFALGPLTAAPGKGRWFEWTMMGLFAAYSLVTTVKTLMRNYDMGPLFGF